jgi:HD-GYP domain-containing protein (c-di-GMP phosphodiesterase class II)
MKDRAAMKKSERQIKTTELTLGMYVSRLDRPWLESPFAFKGFTINNQSDIDTLQRNCQYVFVDLEFGSCPSNVTGCKILPPNTTPEHKQTLDDITHHASKSNHAPGLNEHEKAKSVHQTLQQLFEHVMKEIEAGNKLSIPAIGKQLLPMIASVKQNADSLLQVIMLDDRQPGPVSDAVTTSVLATAIGHRAGIHGNSLTHLAIGGLLYDVGKLALPAELLNEPRGFSPAEYKVVKSHVEEGVKILQQAQGIVPPILEMAQHHHERFDGSGYPTGLKNEHISLFARIAAIVDCFNAITSHRPHAPAMSPYQAALKLYEWRNVDFDPKLVEHLIQVIGVYPIGSPVELSSGEVAIVVAHNQGKRLLPVVAVMMNENGEDLKQARIVDLSQGNDLSIKTAVALDTHPLRLTGLADLYYAEKG